MKKALTYSSFIITSILVILAFVTATTYAQLGFAIILYPFIAYFAYKLFFVSRAQVPVTKIQALPPSTKSAKKAVLKPAEKKDTIVADIDKRAFLKIIGATGLSFFLFSLLNRRYETLFFGKSALPGITALTDASGNKISPAVRQPLDSFQISEIDDNYISYYGFTNSGGAWFIMKEDPENGSFRYIRGDSDFAGNWDNRANLNYDYYHKVFP